MLAACVTGERRGPPLPTPPPSQGVIATLGYDDIVRLGEEYIRNAPLPGAEFESAYPTGVNIWRVRYGLAPKGSGRVLDLYFDGTKGTLLKHEELNAPGSANAAR